MSSPVFTPAPAAPPPIEACYFYHTTTIPGGGAVTGEWDLAPGIDAYLGHVPFAGKRVLDVGAATGFLTFHIEKGGGSVVAYDLSPEQAWDVVPLSGIDAAEHARVRKAHIGAINNGFWLCHAANASQAQLAHGTVYAIDPAIGPVDIAVFGSILLHLRDPFLALHNAALLTRETMIVADILPGGHVLSRVVAALMGAHDAIQAALPPQRPMGDLVEPAAGARLRVSRRARLRRVGGDLPFAEAHRPQHADVHRRRDTHEADGTARIEQTGLRGDACANAIDLHPMKAEPQRSADPQTQPPAARCAARSLAGTSPRALLQIAKRMRSAAKRQQTA